MNNFDELILVDDLEGAIKFPRDLKFQRFTLKNAGDFDGDGFADILVDESTAFDLLSGSAVSRLVGGTIANLTPLAILKTEQLNTSFGLGLGYQFGAEINDDGLSDLVFVKSRIGDDFLSDRSVIILYGGVDVASDLVTFESIAELGGTVFASAVKEPGLNDDFATDVDFLGNSNGDGSATLSVRHEITRTISSDGRFTLEDLFDVVHLIEIEASQRGSSSEFDPSSGRPVQPGEFTAPQPLGDINGDGTDDFFVIEEMLVDDQIFSEALAIGVSSIRVVYGEEGRDLDVFSISERDAHDGFSVEGQINVESVRRAGDVNGDGIGDFFVGVDAGNRIFRESGPSGVHVIFGAPGPSREDVVLTTSGDNSQFFIEGVENIRAVAEAAGDFNNDGFDDFIIDGVSAGDHLIFGADDLAAQSIDALLLDRRQAIFWRDQSVNALGDVDNDGKADIGVVNSSTFDTFLYTGASHAPDNDRNFLGGTVLDDRLDALAGSDTLEGYEGDDILSGGEGRDFLGGGLGDDEIFGGTDNDDAFGNSGADLIRMGDGLDLAFGGDGADRLFGGDGEDTLNGDAGDDLIDGELGDDFLSGGAGSDTAIGGAGRNTAYGGSGDDELRGDLDADLLFGGSDNDRLFGGAEVDTLFGGTGADTIEGGPGDDLIVGQAGGDEIDGGAGADTIFLGVNFDLIFEFPFRESPFVAEADDDFSIPNTALGGDGRDTIYGDASADSVFGGNDRDLLFGGEGDDSLSGDGGDDTLNGDLGSDTIAGGDGVDRLSGSNGDDLIFGNSGQDTIFGGAGDDSLAGGRGKDRILSGEGADFLYGGGGTDKLFAGSGGGEIFGGGGKDRIKVLSGSHLTAGDGGADFILSKGSNDTIFGGNGRDTIKSAGGNSAERFLFGDNGADTILGSRRKDVVEVFGYDRNDGRDVLRGFNDERDFIFIADEDVDFSDLVISGIGNSTNVSFANTSIHIIGVSERRIDEDDFIFL